MSTHQFHYLNSIEELMAIADQWNDLWQRSSTRLPTVRAENIENWVKHFSNGRPFTALCVEQQGRLVAALPLIADRLQGIYPIYRLPVNCWSNAGDLLVDRNESMSETISAVAAGLKQLTPALMCFEEITLQAPQWVLLQQALNDCGGRTFCKHQRPVGVIDLLDDWQSYEQSWSGNHRGAVKRTYRKLGKEGELRVEHCQQPGETLEKLLREAFLIEDLGWKGEEGTSILKSPGILQYMLDEAQLLATSGHTDLWFLYFNDQPIAFEYCQFAKGTCFSQKIGYDPAFSKYGPGRLLRYLQLQEYYADGDCRLLDTLGIFCNSKAKWATRTYEAGILYASAGHPLSNTLLNSYAWAHKQYRALRGAKSASPPQPGAASYLTTKADSAIPAIEVIDGVVEYAFAEVDG